MKWGSASLSYFDPTQQSDKILCKLGSVALEMVYEFELQQTLEPCAKVKGPISKASY